MLGFHYQLQEGSADCGLLAIAIATELTFVHGGIGPLVKSLEEEPFDQLKMRDHLVRCLERGVMQPFPSKRSTKEWHCVEKTYEVNPFPFG